MQITARDFAQTLGLLERFGIEHTVVGRHRGGGLAAKGAGPRCRARRRSRAGRAAGASTSRSATAPTTSRSPRGCCGSPARRCSTTSGRRSSTRSTAASRRPSSCPTRSRRERLARYGATRQDRRLRGPEGGVLPRRLRARPGGARRARARSAPSRSRSSARRPRCRCITASRTTSSAACSSACAARRPSSCRARRSSARELRGSGFVVPEQAIDAQSLIAYADLVVSAGGTMNREAVALGTPVWTTFQGRLGAVDERLIAEGACACSSARRTSCSPSAPRGGARRRARAARSRRCWRPAAHAARSRAAERPPWRVWPPRSLQSDAMRRRIRSATMPLHRHSLPQVAVDGVLVALAYWLAYRLRFDGPAGVPPRYDDLFDATFIPVVIGSVADLRGLRPVREVVALRHPARLQRDRPGGRRRRAGAAALHRASPSR